MSLEYTIRDSKNNEFSTQIPLFNYHLSEGLFLSRTVFNNWEGFNDGYFRWENSENSIILENEDKEIIKDMNNIEFNDFFRNMKSEFNNVDFLNSILPFFDRLNSKDVDFLEIYFE